MSGMNGYHKKAVAHTNAQIKQVFYLVSGNYCLSLHLGVFARDKDFADKDIIELSHARQDSSELHGI